MKTRGHSSVDYAAIVVLIALALASVYLSTQAKYSSAKEATQALGVREGEIFAQQAAETTEEEVDYGVEVVGDEEGFAPPEGGASAPVAQTPPSLEELTLRAIILGRKKIDAPSFPRAAPSPSRGTAIAAVVQDDTELLRTLSLRKAALVKLMRQNPREAEKFFLPEELARELFEKGGRISENVEKRVTARESELQRIVFDFKDGRSEDYYFLADEGGKRIHAYFADKPPFELSGSRVRVNQGVQLGTDLLVSSFTTTYSKPTGYSVKKVLVVPTRFFDDPPYTFTNDQLFSYMFGSGDSVKTYYAEASFGEVSVVGKINPAGDVSPLLQLRNGLLHICQYSNNLDFLLVLGAEVEQLAPGYDYYQFVSSGNPACAGFIGIVPGSITGISVIGGKYSILLGNVLTARGAHEIGHNMGLAHANALECTENENRVPISSLNNCRITQYGDPFDVMNNLDVARHMNAFHKGRLNWLADANTRTVAADGTYSISPIEYQNNGVQSLRIPFDQTGNPTFYYLEYRRPYGQFYDAFPPSDAVVNGVLVHIATEYSIQCNPQTGQACGTALIDATPETAPYEDAALASGKVFEDKLNGISFRTVGLSATEAKVEVKFGPTPCFRSPPEIIIFPVSKWAYAGDSAEYAVAFKNKDSQKCPASTFSFSASAPLGWSASTNVQTTTLSPGQSESATLTVTSPQAASPAMYSVSFVTSGQSPEHSSGASANYNVLPPDTTPPAITIDEPNPLAEVTVLNQEVPVKASALDASGIRGIDIAVDGNVIKQCPPGVGRVPCAASFLTSGSTPKTYALTVTAADNFRTPNTATKSVQVFYNPCVRNSPSASITPASQSGAPGQAKPYAITVRNNDAGGCAAIPFTISGVLPQGWTQTPNGASLTLAKGQQGSMTVSIKPPAGTAQGSYEIRESISNSFTSQPVEATATHEVVEDRVAPTVSISQPTSGLVISQLNQQVAVSASASDPAGIASVELFVDGQPLQTCAASTCSATISTNSLSPGAHEVKAKAIDSSPARNAAETTASFSYLPCVRANPTITISPPRLPILRSTPAVSNARTISITATNNDNAFCGQSSFTITPTLPSGFTQTPSSTSVTLTPGQSSTAIVSIKAPSKAAYQAFAITQTAANQQSTTQRTSAASQIVVQRPDSKAPTVKITAPKKNARTTSSSQITATASDSNGILKIELIIDNVITKTCERATTCTMTAESLMPGSHTIKARAVDDSVNQNARTTSQITFTRA